MKVNKKHGGLETESSFYFIGQIKPTTTGFGQNKKLAPLFNKFRGNEGVDIKTLKFNLLTSKHNELKMELVAFPPKSVYAYSPIDKNTIEISYKDKFDYKLPSKDYNIIEPTWDLIDKYEKEIKLDDWVEVTGYYDFDEIINEDGNVFKFRKRIISSIRLLQECEEEGKVKIWSNRKLEFYNIDYICDFNSPDFREVNNIVIEAGILSTYPLENKDTKVNSFILKRGKEKSIYKEIELYCPYVEPEENNISLAEAFLALNRLDKVKVRCIDNNRLLFGEVIEDIPDNSPFAKVGSSAISKRSSYNIIGNNKNLEIIKIEQKDGYVDKFFKEEDLIKENSIIKTKNNEVIEEAEKEVPSWLKRQG